MKKTIFANVPARMPLNGSALWAFLLWYFKANDAFWLVFIILILIAWGLYFSRLREQMVIDIDNPKDFGKIKDLVSQMEKNKKIFEVSQKVGK